MECPGGEWTSVTVNGENRGRIWADQNMSLGRVLDKLIKPGMTYTCNNQAAVREYLLLTPALDEALRVGKLINNYRARTKNAVKGDDLPF